MNLQSNKQESQLKLLNSLSTSLQGLLSSKSFYQDIVDEIHRHFDFYAIHYWEAIEKDGSAKLAAQLGAYGPLVPMGYELKPASSGITGFVIRSKRPYVCNDVSKDEKFSDLSMPVKSKSQISVPVMKAKKSTER